MLDLIVSRRFSYMDIAFIAVSISVYDKFGLWPAVAAGICLALTSVVIESIAMIRP